MKINVLPTPPEEPDVFCKISIGLGTNHDIVIENILVRCFEEEVFLDCPENVSISPETQEDILVHISEHITDKHLFTEKQKAWKCTDHA